MIVFQKIQKCLLAAAVLGLFSVTARANCWEEAARPYGLDPLLLYAIAGVESDFRWDAVNRDHYQKTKSVDIGGMQINSSHLGWLKKEGIEEKDLYDPCTNVKVGARILYQNTLKYGMVWRAVGAYNAACVVLKGEQCDKARETYIRKVWARYERAVRQTADAAGSGKIATVAATPVPELRVLGE